MNAEIKKEHLVYAFAHCEAWLEAYARSINESSSELTDGVLELFHHQGQRTVNNLSSLSVQSSRSRKTVGKMAAYERTHRKTRWISPQGLKAIRTAQKKRWTKFRTEKHKGVKKGHSYNGTHWMQKPENKARVIKMMNERRKNRVKKAA